MDTVLAVSALNKLNIHINRFESHVKLTEMKILGKQVKLYLVHKQNAISLIVNNRQRIRKFKLCKILFDVYNSKLQRKSFLFKLISNWIDKTKLEN